MKQKKESTFNEIYDYLIEFEIATQDEINLVCSINGNTIQNLNDILYCRVGYRDIEQLKELEL